MEYKEQVQRLNGRGRQETYVKPEAGLHRCVHRREFVEYMSKKYMPVSL